MPPDKFLISQKMVCTSFSECDINNKYPLPIFSAASNLFYTFDSVYTFA